ncbi:FAD binding domain-containing protein [bacterium]|nr:FAD binding domain-containing protein [bacterium]
MKFNVVSPENTKELLELISVNQDRYFRFGAGYTDLLIELKKQPDEDLTVINLAQLTDDIFTAISKIADGFRIGSLVTAKRISLSKDLQSNYSVLTEAAKKLASGQVRQVATIGGNICTASPAGDMACALVALQANCEILNSNGTLRIIPITDFFTGVRTTVLQKDEVLRSIVIPSNNRKNKIYSNFIKIGTRRAMECSIVSLAYHILTDEKSIITHAGIALGSVAPTIMLAKSACDYLLGKSFSSLNPSEIKEFSQKILEYASPISDIRASAWYRTEVLGNVAKSIFEN